MGGSPTDSDENSIGEWRAKVPSALEQLSLYECLAWERGEVAMIVRVGSPPVEGSEGSTRE
jgi:hypothetical protein